MIYYTNHTYSEYDYFVNYYYVEDFNLETILA